MITAITGRIRPLRFRDHETWVDAVRLEVNVLRLG